MAQISDMLAFLRKQKGLSQQELAKDLKISRSAIGMYETGKREPDLETLEAFADFYNVDMNTLTGKHNSNPYINLHFQVTTDLAPNEANAFFQYLSSLGYFVRYDEECIGYHIVSEDRTLDLFLSPEEFKRTAHTSGGMVKGMLESMKHQP